MKKNRILILLGYVLPWICMILFTLANSYYVMNLLYRAIIQGVIILNCSVMFGLAKAYSKYQR